MKAHRVVKKFLKHDTYSRNDISPDMRSRQLMLSSIPKSVQQEYTICKHCGSIVNKQNYCPECDSYMGDTG